MANNRTLVTIALSTLVVLATLIWVARQAPAGLAAAGGLPPQPINMPSFPVPSPTIDGWVNSNDQTSIRSHAWDLWAGITSITPASQGWPVWETWYTDTEVANGPPTLAVNAKFRVLRSSGRATHPFVKLRQFDHQKRRNLFATPLAAAIQTGEQVVGFNKFNADYAQFVWTNNYYKPTVLWNIDKAWTQSTPVADRIIKPFPAPAIGLKPVFQVVRGPNNLNGITVLPYWLGDLTSGPTHSTDPANPTSNTWTQCVVVNTGTGTPPPNLKCQFDNKTAPTGVVGLSQFYNFKLSAAEAVSICKAQPLPTPCNVKAGDYAVLVAMHMTTKEDDNWTWQTFWWNYNQSFPYGGPPPSIKAPFNNYAMCTAYSMTVNPVNSPTGTNVLCYNPYLETGLSGVDGIQSNCMSCHGVASYGNNTNNPGYPPVFNDPNAYISVTVPADDTTYYNCQTTTDFSWFLAGLTGNPPANLPACQP